MCMISVGVTTGHGGEFTYCHLHLKLLCVGTSVLTEWLIYLIMKYLHSAFIIKKNPLPHFLYKFVLYSCVFGKQPLYKQRVLKLHVSKIGNSRPASYMHIVMSSPVISCMFHFYIC